MRFAGSEKVEVCAINKEDRFGHVGWIEKMVRCVQNSVSPVRSYLQTVIIRRKSVFPDF